MTTITEAWDSKPEVPHDTTPKRSTVDGDTAQNPVEARSFWFGRAYPVNLKPSFRSGPVRAAWRSAVGAARHGLATTLAVLVALQSCIGCSLSMD